LIGNPLIFVGNPLILKGNPLIFKGNPSIFIGNPTIPRSPDPDPKNFLWPGTSRNPKKLKICFFLADLNKETHINSNFCQFV